MAEDHRLADGDWAVDVWQCREFVLEAVALDVVLFYVVQTLLLTSQFYDDRVVNDTFGEPHHLLIVRSRKQQQLTVSSQTSETKKQAVSVAISKFWKTKIRINNGTFKYISGASELDTTHTHTHTHTSPISRSPVTWLSLKSLEQTT